MNSLITNSSNTNFYNHISTLLNECLSFSFNVAFINYSGLQLLLDSFNSCEKRAVKGRILTSTYLNFTEVKALEKIDNFDNLELKIFDSSKIGFHPKAYIFEFEDEYKIIVGSSNITASAFKSNIEWNIKTVSKKDALFTNEILDEFENLWGKSFFVNDDFLNQYKNFQEKQKVQGFKYQKELIANSMQTQALERLEFLRSKGENKALAIASTGSGKTYLSLLDIKAFNPKKTLFIVHRENILQKAKSDFEEVFISKRCGLFTGNKKELDSEFLFSTIQTLSSNCDIFKKDEFDYIVVDEAHHISSPSYKKVIEHFKAKFLLGLTATPNRSDDESIYKYFDDNIACDIRLNDALEQELISPFHYFGISDVKVDLEGIDLSDTSKISSALMINRRVDFIIEKMNFYGFSGTKRKALGFCISKEHASFMSEEFNKRGIKSQTLNSSDSILKREESIKKLESDEDDLEFIFTVDIFNEGIDIPSVNLVLMLRPTNSSIVFTQQLGRGLRKNKDKEFLTLLDFIGNHNRAFLVAFALVGDKILDKDSVKLALVNNFANISNAHIIMDEISRKAILQQLDRENFSSIKYLKEKYFSFKEQMGNKILKLVDYINYDDLISPLPFINESKSYIEFLSKIEKNEELKIICKDEKFIKAIRFIESLLPVKRVYEFVILKYLLDNQSCTIEDVKKALQKYLKKIDENTIIHAFEFLNQNYFDSSQKSRFLKLVELKDKKLTKTKEFIQILKTKKEYLEDSLEYGIIVYENSFGIEDFGLPFLKLYEKYNMLNIAQLCNFNKIHSSFRGSGFLKFKDDFFLFITIEKDKFSKGEKYHNAFLDKQIFTYSSKPSHTQEKGDGARLIENKNHGVKLHIFVRKFSHVDKKVQGFTYLGLANTIEYKNNKPIDCKLKLEIPLNDNLFEEFTKIVN